MASVSFGCVGHARPALWSRGCDCKHKWTEASICYAKHTDFLHFYDAVHVPPLPCRMSVCHIGCCTHWAGSHFRQSYRRLQLRSCACLVVPATQAVPLEGRCTQKRLAAHPVVTGWIFEGGNAFFQKHIEAILKGPCSFVSQVYGGAPKK